MVSASSGSSFKAGDVLTCMSDGYPQPSYQWTDSHAVLVSNTSTTTLTEGWFNLTCTATGNFTTPCRASASVSGYITGKNEVNIMFEVEKSHQSNMFVINLANKLITILTILFSFGLQHTCIYTDNKLTP